MIEVIPKPEERNMHISDVASRIANKKIDWVDVGPMFDRNYDICIKCGKIHNRRGYKRDVKLPFVVQSRLGNCSHDKIRCLPKLRLIDKLSGNYFLVEFTKCDFCNELIAADLNSSNFS